MLNLHSQHAPRGRGRARPGPTWPCSTCRRRRASWPKTRRASRRCSAAQGANDFDDIGYGGRAAGRPHRYYFKLAALDTALNLKPGAKRKDVLAAMEGHVLGEGWLMGTYGRARR
jgi:phosphatidylethanolamine-binding protein (PEBP) family uncharacterized protein